MPDELLQSAPYSPTFTRTAVEQLIDAVSAIVGGAANITAREKAIECLDRAADRMNMAGVFFFEHKEVTFSSFTLGQETLTMPSDWGWPDGSAVTRDSAGNVTSFLEWKPWDLFRRRTQGSNGRPEILSINSELDSLIYVMPKIDPSTLTDILLSYYARVPRVSEATTLTVLPETREALITGGQALLVQYRYIKYPNIWQPMMEDFNRTIMGAKAASSRWLGAANMAAVPDLTGRLHFLSLDASAGPRPVYIQVG